MPNTSNPFSLAGRTALVTGGTQGVGAAICRSLAQAGADLVIHGLRDDEPAQQTLAACRDFGRRAELLVGDLLGPPQKTTSDLFERALAIAPEIDTLVNNAGTFLDGDFLELSEETFDRTWRLNVTAGVFLTQAFARHRVAAGQGGRVLFTGSINGLLSEPEHVAYDTSKGAVAALVRSLCVELAPRKIRVNAIAPGLVRTPLTRIVDDNAELAAWMELHTPNGQVPSADVCGPPAAFLLSDAAEHIHGQTLYVDGGMSAWQQPNMPE
ncbi:SDR family NAD(P)-dependent oxidoreductase [Candidatus Laterigemmans baculatus]|uniref:SDR family NAD(P)-dependent oxidoreductase n=1 Tax=Candidatus Laterigemmans baculatus TaxID=2770505 RepID=UPI0013DA9C65|nr:SDR family oxidoreductase [Candidatus Laterigemmans baculatus]